MAGAHATPLRLDQALLKLVVVAALFGWMMVLPTLAHEGGAAFNPLSMVSFGFILLAAYMLGELLERVGVPHITAYLFTGVALSEEATHVLHLPQVMGVMSHEIASDLQVFNALAVALIALAAGSSLELGALRSALRLLLSLVFSQALGMGIFVGAAVLLLAGPVPALALPELAAAPWSLKLGAALVVAIIGAAQSPAAAIAVLRETRAQGPISQTILGTSVLNNLVIILVFTAALSVVGAMVGQGEGGLARELLVRMGGAAALGVVLGVAIAAWTRWVKELLLLLLAALGFLVTYVAGALGVEPLLVFLFAGFTVRNFTRQHAPLQRAVEVLALPTWVVFFFVAGASLHLAVLRDLLPYAVGLYLVRNLSLWAFTAVGARLGRGPAFLGRLGWLGFTPQAGIAIAMAGQAGTSPVLGELAAPVATLALAGIALNEMLGPMALKLALGWAGELPTPTEAHTTPPPEPSAQEEPSEETWQGLPEWLPEPGHQGFDPWGTLPDLGSRRLGELTRALRADLQGLVRDLRSGPVGQRRDEATRFLSQLRRELLRAHRRSAARARAEGLGREEFAAELRAQPGALATVWEDALLNRAAGVGFQAEERALEGLIAAVDRLVAQLPEATEVVLDPTLLEPRPEDPPWTRAQKTWLALRRGFGFGPRERVVEVRSLARFALSGQVAQHLPELAGVMVLSERHVLARARNVFECYRRGMEELVRSPDFFPEHWSAALDRLRADVEEEFQLALREVDRLSDETVRVAASVLGRPYQELNRMLQVGGTPALPPRAVRYSQVFPARQSALREVGEGLRAAVELHRAEAAGMAMEMQLLRLSIAVQELAQERSEILARDLRKRLAAPSRKVRHALDATVEALVQALRGAQDHAELAARVREHSGALGRTLEEALGITASLRHNLRTQTTLEPLRQGMSRGVDTLTERFTVAVRPPGLLGRRLPRPPQRKEVPFRELASQALDTELGRELSQVSDALQARVDELSRALDDLQRGLGFNTELTLAELDVLPAGPVGPAARDLVRDLLLGTLQRLALRIHPLDEALERVDQEGAQQVRQVVGGAVDAFAALIVEGRWDDPRLRLARADLGRWRRPLLARRPGDLSQLGALVQDAARWALGDEGYSALRDRLGLPDQELVHEPGPAAFALAQPAVELPIVFRRLFSDAALEAGDLLTGREREVEEVRRVLTGEGAGRSRAVAVIGVGGVGQGAVLNTLLRGLSDRVRVIRHTLEEPVTDPAQVDELLSRVSEDCLVVVEGLEYLFSLEPGGFAPLRRFVERVVADRGRNAWLISAERPVWAFADRVVALHDAFPERVTLNALDAEGLRRAILDRHNMSGYQLRFARPSGQSGLWLGRGTPARSQERYGAHYFARLEAATGGILSDALRLWMASVVEVSEERNEIVLGDVPRTPIKALRRLPEDVLMTLRQVSRQGRITARGHARQFRMEVPDSEAMLDRLRHWGLLERGAEGSYSFAPGLAGSLYRVLRERRLVG